MSTLPNEPAAARAPGPEDLPAVQNHISGLIERKLTAAGVSNAYERRVAAEQPGQQPVRIQRIVTRRVASLKDLLTGGSNSRSETKAFRESFANAREQAYRPESELSPKALARNASAWSELDRSASKAGERDRSGGGADDGFLI